jgi:hypothetical protein
MLHGERNRTETERPDSGLRADAREPEQRRAADAAPGYYLNALVTVHYACGSYSDTGRITFMSGDWIELTKESRERLLIPLQAIRIMKLVSAADAFRDAETLLRATDGPEPKELKEK